MARLDCYISDNVKSKAKFFALLHKVSMSTLVEDSLIQLISHHELCDANSNNYENLSFIYPDGGFENNNIVPWFCIDDEISDKLIVEFYGGDNNVQTK